MKKKNGPSHGTTMPCTYCAHERDRKTLLEDRAKREITGTPGPWRVHGTEADVETESGIPICSMHREYGNGTTPVERDTNCYLIAAAPELETALRAMLESYTLSANSQRFHKAAGVGRDVLHKIHLGRTR